MWRIVRTGLPAVVILGAILTLSIIFAKPERAHRTIKQHRQCSRDYCNGHGDCLTYANDSFLCECDRWFHGDRCELSCPQLCNKRGDCSTNDSVLYFVYAGPIALVVSGNETLPNETLPMSQQQSVGCSCEAGYAGQYCELACPLNCSGNGECLPTGECGCSEGFVGAGCELECPPCDLWNGYCDLDPLTAAPTCICPQGWGLNCSNQLYDRNETYDIQIVGNESLSITAPPEIVDSSIGSTFTYTFTGLYAISVTILSNQSVGISTDAKPALGSYVAPNSLQISFSVNGIRPNFSFEVTDSFCKNGCFGQPCVNGLCDCMGNSTCSCGVWHDCDPIVPIHHRFSLDWRFALPQSNPFPPLADGFLQAGNKLPVAAVTSVVSIYVAGVAFVILVRPRPVQLTKFGQTLSTSPFIQYFAKSQFIRTCVLDHLLLGSLFVDDLSGFPAVHRLSVFFCSLLASLTVSAFWYDKKKTIGAYTTVALVTTLVLTPFEYLLLLLLRQPDSKSLEEKKNAWHIAEIIVASAVVLATIVWCSYTSILFGWYFGPTVSAAWFKSFAVTVVLQTTVLHVFGVAAWCLCLELYRCTRQSLTPQDSTSARGPGKSLRPGHETIVHVENVNSKEQDSQGQAAVQDAEQDSQNTQQHSQQNTQQNSPQNSQQNSQRNSPQNSQKDLHPNALRESENA